MKMKRMSILTVLLTVCAATFAQGFIGSICLLKIT